MIQMPLDDRQRSLKRLNLGCGVKRLSDALNVDLRAVCEPDLVWDLDEAPYPLPSDHYEAIYAHDVIEHLSNPVELVEEAHRLLVPDGLLEITTPHYSCSNAFTDPTHRRQLGYFSFDYFTDSSQWSFYSGARFEIAERTLVFHPGRISKYFARWANRHPDVYERRLAWIVPSWFLIFRLRAIKPERGFACSASST